jgi:hypothetical protein
LAVVQRDEGVEDRFRWGVDDALNAELNELLARKESLEEAWLAAADD